MKGQVLSDSEMENATEAGAVDGIPATFISTGSRHSGLENETHNINDEKTPEVFGKLWREVVSVFTLACAPGLNVRHLWGTI